MVHSTSCGLRSLRPGTSFVVALLVCQALVWASPVDVSKSSAAQLPTGSKQLGESFFDDFRHGGLDPDRWITAGYWSNGQPFKCGWDPSYWTIDHHTLELQLKKERFKHGTWDLPYTAGELLSIRHYGEGCYSVCMRPASQSGVSSSFYIQNFVQDGENVQQHEVDVEFIGNNHYAVQTNFFSRGYDPNANSGSGNEELHDVGFDVTQNFAAYSFRWTQERIDWWVNDQHVRVAFKDETVRIPDPYELSMNIAGNIWPVNEQAEEWAGELDPNFDETSVQYAWIHHEQGKECKIRTQCGPID